MDALVFVIVFAMLATAGSLLLGVGSMAHGGVFDRLHSTQFMSARVILQAVVLVLLAIALLVH